MTKWFKFSSCLLVILTNFKWSQSFEEECSFIGKGIFVNGSGVITSPGYEHGQYPPMVECSWKFSGPPNKFINLKFTDFELEENQQCLEDYIVIEWLAIDYESQKHCGNSIPEEITVRTSQELLLFFRSNGKYQFRGFKLEYSLLDKFSPCPLRHLKCRNNMCVPRSVICDKTDDCLDGTDEEKCPGYKVEKPETCGQTPIHPETGNDRIVGGRSAVPYSWPWQVSLQRTDVFPSGHFCGGSLINDLWLVTATHCLLNRHINEIRVVLGIYHQFERDGNEITRYVEDTMIYPGYEEESLRHDISLLRLNAPVKFNERIQPVCLPQPMTELSVGTMVHVTGWGETLVSGKSSVLKQVMHPVADWDYCSKGHEDIRNVLNTTFCAGVDAGGHATCFSDSGGPLVAEDNSNWTLYGIVSWGATQCAVPNKPAVFTKVSNYVIFINTIYG